MQQPVAQHDQLGGQGMAQQMVLCPVRLVYETQILVQPGEQISPNQTFFINPQNPPPWMQNSLQPRQPIQNQVVYVQQLPNNIVQQPIDQNQLYIQQNFNYPIQQQMLAPTQDLRSMQLANIMPNVVQNIQSIPDRLNQNGQCNQIIQNQMIRPVQNQMVSQNMDIQRQVFMRPPMPQQTNIQRPVMTVNQMPMQQQNLTSMPNVVSNTGPNVVSSMSQNIASSVGSNAGQNVGQTYSPNVGRGPPVPNIRPNNVMNVQPVLKVRESTPESNKTVNNPIGNVVPNIRSFTPNYYRPIQPRPQLPQNTANISKVPQHIPVQTVQNSQAYNQDKSNSQNSCIIQHLNSGMRKRKSESPDEIQKKMAALKPNFNTQSMTVTKIVNEIGTNTSPVHRPKNIQFGQMVKNNENPSEMNKDMQDKDKLIRNTVFTQARGRVLQDKVEEVKPMMVENVIDQAKTGQNVIGQISLGNNMIGTISAGQNIIGQITTGQNVMGPITSAPNVSGPMTSSQNVVGPMTSSQNVAGPMTSSQNVIGPIYTGQIGIGHMKTGPNVSGPMKMGQNMFAQINSGQSLVEQFNMRQNAVGQVIAGQSSMGPMNSGQTFIDPVNAQRQNSIQQIHMQQNVIGSAVAGPNVVESIKTGQNMAGSISQTVNLPVKSEQNVIGPVKSIQNINETNKNVQNAAEPVKAGQNSRRNKCTESIIEHLRNIENVTKSELQIDKVIENKTNEKEKCKKTAVTEVKPKVEAKTEKMEIVNIDSPIVKTEVDENMKINENKDMKTNENDKTVMKQEKLNILTHVVDGYVIQESNFAFPIRKPLKEKTIHPNTKSLKTEGTERDLLKECIKEELTSNHHVDIPLLPFHYLLLDNKEEKKEEVPAKEEEKADIVPFAQLQHSTVKSWTVEDLSTYLMKYNWKETVSLLQDHEIDGESLYLVSKQQLLTIGVTEDHAEMICEFVKS